MSTMCLPILREEVAAGDGAYEAVKADYIMTKRKEKLLALARQSSEKGVEGGAVSGWLTKDHNEPLSPLSEMETARLLEQLFSANEKRGHVLTGDKAVAYVIVEQKLLDKDKLLQKRQLVADNVKKLKANLLQSNLIDTLRQKYPIEIFYEGI